MYLLAAARAWEVRPSSPTQLQNSGASSTPAGLDVGPRVAQPRKEAKRATKNQTEETHGQALKKSVKLFT